MAVGEPMPEQLSYITLQKGTGKERNDNVSGDLMRKENK